MGKALRRCVGCRQSLEKSSLIRFVADSDGRLQVDLSQVRPGRGVYVCPRWRCLQQAEKQSGFSRGMRRRLENRSALQVGQMVLDAGHQEAKTLVGVGLADGRARWPKQTQNAAAGKQDLERLEIVDDRLRQRWAVLTEQLRVLQKDVETVEHGFRK